eukprot:TRINITY_DN1310_c0_g1_i1.p1 TRINITY_DN1310_c0_g1~~TRINITY_DN1310_c0_g1_i1.p1  ORF type:complete len:228 (+),score=80.74 TRINITY_DN1310_c0_g1_i1:130-813(+)
MCIRDRYQRRVRGISCLPMSNQAFADASDMAHKLVYWEDPKNTGVAVVTINLLFYLFTFGGYTVPQLVVLCLWVSLVARFAFVIGIHAFAIFNPSLKRVPAKLAKQMAESTISEDDFKPVADTMLAMVNHVMGFWSGVSSCQDKMLVMKVLVVLHVASYVASWFSMCSLAYLMLMGVFTVPRAIRDHQVQLQDAMTQVCNQISDKMAGVLAAIPKASQLKKTDKKEQ